MFFLFVRSLVKIFYSDWRKWILACNNFLFNILGVLFCKSLLTRLSSFNRRFCLLLLHHELQVSVCISQRLAKASISHFGYLILPELIQILLVALIKSFDFLIPVLSSCPFTLLGLMLLLFALLSLLSHYLLARSLVWRGIKSFHIVQSTVYGNE